MVTTLFTPRASTQLDTILAHSFSSLAHRLGVDVQRFCESCDYFHASYAKSDGLSEEDQKLVPKLGGEAAQRKEKAGISKPNHFRDVQNAIDAGSAPPSTPASPPSPTLAHPNPTPTKV